MRNLVPDFILEQYTQRQFHGTLRAVSLFADVSGFTTTTEALMQHGAEGAEILADTMLAIFTPLVQSVYDQGGFIAGFAGDALTALFPCGASGASWQLALQSAWQIKQHMLANPQQITRLGAFNFAVKLGLADGETEWGILSSADQRRHAYYFKGEAIDGCTRAEHQAASGDLVISARVLDALGQCVTVEPVADYWRVTNVAESQTFEVLQSIPEAERSGAETSKVFRACATNAQAFFAPELLQSPVRGEFRQVVSVFINLQGNPTRQDLVAFAEPFFRLLTQYDGYLCRFDFGDKGCRLLLFWGAPKSFENDLERALNFVLDLRQAVTDIPLRAGITYQMAYAGFAGASSREEYTCYSSRVNLAARLMSAATWDSVWLDEPTARQASKHFAVEPVGAFTFKGFADQQPVLALKGRQTSASTQFYKFRLVGRQRELARLDEFVSPIFQGEFAGTLTIYGEAGIGKSRLLHGFQRVIVSRETAWFICQTDQILRQPLNPFRYFLRNYFDQIAPTASDDERKRRFDQKMDALIARTPDPALKAELDRTRSFLGALVGLAWSGSLYEQLEPKLRFENTLGAIKTLLQAESRRQPVILQIEDVHWLDSDSAELLRRLTRNVSGYPFAILASSRAEPAPDLFDPGARQQAFDPGALATGDVQYLAEDVLGSAVAKPLVEWLSQRTSGNPFFVEQLLLYMKERGLLSEGKDGLTARAEGVMVPADVGVVLTARLDRLTQDVKKVVQTAAVLGREFQVQVLSQMLRDDARLDAEVKQAEQEAIWSALSEIRYIFKHALLRDAAYDMQLRSRLRELHALAGQAIEQVYAADLAPHYADLAYHFGKAEDRERELRYLRLAGAQAQAAYANAAAIDYYQRLLRPELAAGLPASERVGTLISLGQVLELLGQWGEANDHYQRGLQLAEQSGDQPSQARCQHALGALLWKRGENDQAWNWLAQAHHGFESAGDRDGVGQVILIQGNVAWSRGDYETAQKLSEEGLALMQEAGDMRGVVNAINRLGAVAKYQGDYARARRFYEDGLSRARTQNDPYAIAVLTNNLGIIAHGQGNYTETRALFEESLALRRKVGDKWGVATSLHNLGSMVAHQNEHDTALRFYEESLALRRELGDKPGISSALLNMGNTIAFGKGDYRQAAGLVRESVALRKELGNKIGVAECLCVLGTLAQVDGRHDRAVRIAATAATILEATGGAFEPEQRAAHEQVVALARAQLGETAFDAAWAEGHAWTLEEAVEYAMKEAYGTTA